MKKIFITTILVLCAICGMKAQSDTVTVHVDGTVDSMTYEDDVRSSGSFFSRLFG